MGIELPLNLQVVPDVYEEVGELGNLIDYVKMEKIYVERKEYPSLVGEKLDKKVA